MSASNGGPAFPIVVPGLVYGDGSNDPPCVNESGMSLRDYFAAHAPAEPQKWFTPAMSPQPEATYDHEHGVNCCDCSETNWKERWDWRGERERQRLIQWPYAWADAQLTVREMF